MKVRNAMENLPKAMKRKTTSPTSKSGHPGGVQSAASAKPLTQEPDSARKILFWKSIDSIIKRLDRNNRTHLSLIPLLNLIKELPAGLDGLPLNTLDKDLLLKILDVWKGINGESLTEKIKAEYDNLERILQNDSGPRYIFVQEDSVHRPLITIREEKSSSDSKEGENFNRLDMKLSLKRLGRFQILIEQRDSIRKCSIYGEQDRSCRELNRVKKTLWDRIRKSRLSLTSLKIRNRTLSSSEPESPIRGGIELWG